MIEGNGEGKILKKCPFWREWCDEELRNSCGIAVDMTFVKVVLGVKQTGQGKMCGIPALAAIMSNKSVPVAQEVKFNRPLRGV